MKKESFEQPLENKAEQEKEHSPENLIEEGEEKKDSIIGKIREEGEMIEFKVYQTIYKAIKREKPHLKDFEGFKEKKEDVSASKSKGFKLMQAINEVSYGALSMGARKIIEKILKGTTDFSEVLSRLSDKASKRFEDARSLYKIEE